MSDPSILRRAAERAAVSRNFLGWDIANLVLRDVLTRDEIADHLGLNEADVPRIELCRSPRRESGYFGADLTSIASYLDTEVGPLAHLIRLSDALRALTAARGEDAVGMSAAPALLAAARDSEVDRTAVADLPPSRTGFQPTWLQRAVHQFWNAGSPQQFPWPVELEVLLRLPLAIVELDELATDGVSTWLAERNTPLYLHAAPRRLSAALVAYGGSGIIFVDRALSEEERRVSITHEAAHFLHDYLLPRQELEELAPSLVDVIDGLREPDQEDAVTALIRRVPLGIHSHLLARSASGDYLSRETEDAEERATRISWELLAPQEMVMRQIGGQVNSFVIARALQSDFGLPAPTAHAYGKFLVRIHRDRDPLRDRFGIE